MFGIARRKSHTQLVRQELNESLDHLMQAATHAARGAGSTMGPRMSTARDRVTPAAGKVRNVATTGWGSTIAALAPLAAAATKSARQADSSTRKAKAKNAKALQRNAKALQKNAKAMKGKGSGKSRSKLTGLLIAGAAVGAAGALVMRRRKQQSWDEYDPSRPVGASTTGSTAVGTDTESMLPASLPPDRTTGSSFTATGTGTTSPTSAVLTEGTGDQTSSPMHSPTVAKMARGTTPEGVTDELHTSASRNGLS